jgi:hypothetical protein
VNQQEQQKYNELKNAWINAHPNRTPRKTIAACKRFEKQVVKSELK